MRRIITHDLVKRLGSNDKRVVVTTIQKITTMMRKFDQGLYQKMRIKSRDSEWPLSWMNATVP